MESECYKKWQGISTTRLILGEVIVPRDDSMLAFSTELLNYIIAFATPGKSGHCKTFAVKFKNANQSHR